MVRTLADGVRVGGKSSKKGGFSNSGDSSRNQSPSSSEKGFSGYNTVCPRETPSWQKPITSFFITAEKPVKKQNNQSTSKHIDDVDMALDNNQLEQLPGDANGETMEHESSPQAEEIESAENSAKENNPPNSNLLDNVNGKNTDDMEMNEVSENAKKKVNLRSYEDEEDNVPKKKIKLDANMYRHFEMLEQ